MAARRGDEEEVVAEAGAALGTEAAGRGVEERRRRSRGGRRRQGAELGVTRRDGRRKEPAGHGGQRGKRSRPTATTSWARTLIWFYWAG